MMRYKTKLEMVQRHVRGGRQILARQGAIVERLRVGGFSTVQAEAMLSEFQRTQYLHEDHLARLQSGVFARTEEYDRCAERQRFIDWTFEKELEQIEDLLGQFDRNSPFAEIAEARKLIALLGILNKAPEMDAAFPRFLGYDMHWWVDCISLSGESERWLKDLGIHAAADAWRAAEYDWDLSRNVSAGKNPAYGVGIRRVSNKR